MSFRIIVLAHIFVISEYDQTILITQKTRICGELWSKYHIYTGGQISNKVILKKFVILRLSFSKKTKPFKFAYVKFHCIGLGGLLE